MQGELEYYKSPNTVMCEAGTFITITYTQEYKYLCRILNAIKEAFKEESLGTRYLEE